MRVAAIALAICLGGCLAAPPGPAGGSGGAEADAGTGQPGAPDGGGPVDACSHLDLAYLSRVGIGGPEPLVVSLDDIAVVINPGPNAIATDQLTASVDLGTASVSAAVTFNGRSGRLDLPAGEAHGSLGIYFADAVTPYFTESWTDVSFPSLSVEFGISRPAFGADHAIDIVLQLVVDDDRVKLPITLVDQGLTAVGVDALEGQRVSAECDG